MKYQKIYSVLENHTEINVNDRSYWRTGRSDYIANRHPLNIILECHKVGLRIWVDHEDNKYTIATADLTLKSSSREYSESFRHYSCRNQAEAADRLEQLLSYGESKSCDDTQQI